MIQIQNNSLEVPHRMQDILIVGAGKKMSASIIRDTCTIDTKYRVFFKGKVLLSAYV
jgi:hypothetical protein